MLGKILFFKVKVYNFILFLFYLFGGASKSDNDLGHHVKVGTQPKKLSTEDRKKTDFAQMAIDVFKHGELKFHYSDLVVEIALIYAVKDRQAKNHIKNMFNYKFIEYESDNRSKIRLCNGVKFVQLLCSYTLHLLYVQLCNSIYSAMHIAQAYSTYKD